MSLHHTRFGRGAVRPSRSDARTLIQVAGTEQSTRPPLHVFHTAHLVAFIRSFNISLYGIYLNRSASSTLAELFAIMLCGKMGFACVGNDVDV